MTDSVKTGRVNNGELKTVRFGEITRAVRVIEREGGLQFALKADFGAMQRIASGTIDDVEHTVRRVAKSDHVTGMVVLTVDPVSAS